MLILSSNVSAKYELSIFITTRTVRSNSKYLIISPLTGFEDVLGSVFSRLIDREGAHGW